MNGIIERRDIPHENYSSDSTVTVGSDDDDDDVVPDVSTPLVASTDDVSNAAGPASPPAAPASPTPPAAPSSTPPAADQVPLPIVTFPEDDTSNSSSPISRVVVPYQAFTTGSVSPDSSDAENEMPKKRKASEETDIEVQLKIKLTKRV